MRAERAATCVRAKIMHQDQHPIRPQIRMMGSSTVYGTAGLASVTLLLSLSTRRRRVRTRCSLCPSTKTIRPKPSMPVFALSPYAPDEPESLIIKERGVLSGIGLGLAAWGTFTR